MDTHWLSLATHSRADWPRSTHTNNRLLTFLPTKTENHRWQNKMSCYQIWCLDWFENSDFLDWTVDGHLCQCISIIVITITYYQEVSFESTSVRRNEAKTISSLIWINMSVPAKRRLSSSNCIADDFIMIYYCNSMESPRGECDIENELIRNQSVPLFFIAMIQ